MEKQHNRGQDGAGIANIKFDMEPGQRYISRVRSIQKNPIQDVFEQVTARFEQIQNETNNNLNQTSDNDPFAELENSFLLNDIEILT